MWTSRASGLAPPHDHLGEEIGPILPTGCPNADVLRELMRRSFDILDQHPINAARRAAGKLPANGVWFWAEGTAARAAELPGALRLGRRRRLGPCRCATASAS